MKIAHVLVALFVFGGAAFGQMRPPEKEATVRDVKAAPATFNAQYQGGFFGVSDKESGTLNFDDANERLVFFGEDGKERFGIPYASVLMVYPDEKSVTTTAGNVVKYIPLPGAGLAGLIKEKRRYLILNYDDPDVDAKGTTSFKLESQQLLDSAIFSIGTKAKLKQRGEAYVRPRVVQANPVN
ncbi:MAG: hypothetical protein ABIR33_10470 [Pyrinomonadaceae bacterium]